MVGIKKFSILILSLCLILCLITGCSQSQTSSTGEKIINVGIAQLLEHPALDSAREGFIAGLESKGFKDGENIKIDYQNAQNDMSIAQTIAQNFVSNKKDIILAIATPTAQSVYNATKDIPILITAVTDPVKAELVKSMEKSGTNVTGTSDAVSLEKQFELIKKLVPKAKKVGILYNTSEANSEVQVNNAKDIAPDFELEIITDGVTNINDVPQSLTSLLEKIDVLYIPTDNVIASSMPLIFSKCVEKNIPIIGAESAHVKAGAIATNGIDYYNLGFKTGLMAVDIINGAKPEDMGISMLEDTKIVINMDSAKKFNITISNDLKEKAEFIESGEDGE